MSTAIAVKLEALLNSVMQRFHVEYHGYFTNHLSQGLIALYRIGANESQLQAFYDNYTHHILDERINHSIPSQQFINEGNYREFLGKKTHFLDYVDFFSQRIQQHGVQQTINQYLADLHPGVCSAAFHTLIQLGYGVDVMSERVIAEGLAYLCYSYQQFFTPRFAATSVDGAPEIPRLLETFEELRSSTLLKTLRSRAGFSETSFHEKMKIVAEKMTWDSGNLLGDCLPPTLDLPKELSPQDASIAINRMVWISILLFQKAGARDFFLLHGVSATRATKKLLPLINTGELRADILRHLWRGLLVTYVCQGLPSLFNRRTSRGMDKQLAQMEPQQRWKRVLDVGLNTTEEHIIKMLYSLKEEEKEFDSQPEDDRHLFSKQLFLKTAEDMIENSGPRGEHFEFDGVGFQGTL